MTSRRYKKTSRKTKKGGIFYRNKYIVPSDECEPNKLTSIKGSKALHANYQKCCPKGMFGTKNSSPYCKQLDLNYQSAIKGENDANQYHGFEDEDVNKMNQYDSYLNPSPKKSWYKFWGGKTRKAHKKHSHRNKRK